VFMPLFRRPAKRAPIMNCLRISTYLKNNWGEGEDLDDRRNGISLV